MRAATLAGLSFMIGSVAFGATSAFAQGAADPVRTAYLQAHSQLGILQYCADNGHVDVEVVEIQRKLLPMLPKPSDTSGTDEVEAAGKKGVFYLGPGVEQDVEAVAKQSNGSVADFCKVMGDALKQASGMIQ